MHCALCSVHFVPFRRYAPQYSVQHKHTQVVKWVLLSSFQIYSFLLKMDPLALHLCYAVLDVVVQLLISYCLLLEYLNV